MSGCGAVTAPVYFDDDDDDGNFDLDDDWSDVSAVRCKRGSAARRGAGVAGGW